MTIVVEMKISGNAIILVRNKIAQSELNLRKDLGTLLLIYCSENTRECVREEDGGSWFPIRTLDCKSEISQESNN